MIFLDTSALVDSLCGPRTSEFRLRRLISLGETVMIPAVVFYEWLRGPRIAKELADQENIFPIGRVIPFEHAEAVIAAQIYRAVKSPRNREIDIAIAATAISHDATLWTLNARDFSDVPGLQLL